MSGAPGRDPPRWTEVGGDSPLARRAGELLRLPSTPPLGPVRRARIGLRLASRRAAGRASWRARYGVAAALVTAVIAAAAAAAAMGGVGGWLRRAREAAMGQTPVSAPSAPRAGERSWPQQRQPPRGQPQLSQPRSAAPAVSPRSPLVSPSDEDPGSGAARSAPAAGPAPRRTVAALALRQRDAGARQASPSPDAAPAAAVAAPPATGAPAAAGAAPPATPEGVTVPDQASTDSASAPDSEARLVSEALMRLHVDGASALALLAEHRRRFPAGALASEARIAEVQALLFVGRRSQALEVLDRLSMGRLPRGAELAVLRAELRAEAQRCQDALADFDRCAAAAGCRPEAEERALYGRASCRGKLGQSAAARVDFERYLARFPHGRFAGPAARALRGTN